MVVDRVKYSPAFVVLENELKMVDVLDGGKTSGRVAFEVPQDVMSLGYEPLYDGLWDYNLKWIKQ